MKNCILESGIYCNFSFIRTPFAKTPTPKMLHDGFTPTNASQRSQNVAAV
jgi:hypothetical protein